MSVFDFFSFGFGFGFGFGRGRGVVSRFAEDGEGCGTETVDDLAILDWGGGDRRDRDM